MPVTYTVYGFKRKAETNTPVVLPFVGYSGAPMAEVVYEGGKGFGIGL